MKIADDWEFDDLVTGLKLKVMPGRNLDHLQITNISGNTCDNRDFWFTKEGEFDGTGSCIAEGSCAEESVNG